MKKGKFIKLWGSLKEASEHYNLSISPISNCCHGRIGSVKGYQWVFEDDYLENRIITKKNNKNKKIIQLSLDGEFIREWDSMKEASIFMGYPNDRSSISRCCNGKTKKAFGYIWEYKK